MQRVSTFGHGQTWPPQFVRLCPLRFFVELVNEDQWNPAQEAVMNALNILTCLGKKSVKSSEVGPCNLSMLFGPNGCCFAGGGGNY